MSGARNDTQRKKPNFPKPAIASVLLGALGISILVLRITLYRPWWSEFVGRNIAGLFGIAGLILGLGALVKISRPMAAITALVILSPFLLFYSFALMGSRLLVTCTFYAMLAILLGLLISAAVVHLMSRSREHFRGIGFIVLGIFVTTFLLDAWWAETCGPMSSAAGMACGYNLSQLGKAMLAYANEHQGQYPAPNRWCDLLTQQTDVQAEYFLCPGVKLQWKRQVLPWPVPRKARCYYAMNPDCRPNSPPDMVLLFETKGGWNQFGGSEILTMDNHRGFLCNILFNDGHVEHVTRRHFWRLKWTLGQQNNKPGQSNSTSWRMPGSDCELDYWLKNMVWYHRFTTEEIKAAVGLTEDEIAAALTRFDIRPDNRPRQRLEGLPLLVLPYPGGRHPRIGFLEGAIDPQRETKFSVFTPWDPNSYIVVDLPEAIWSNLGLTYLAHTHIDTIWTKQGVDLPKLEWNRRADATLDMERELPNGIAFGAAVKPTRDAVHMELWVKNGTKEPLTGLRVQICVMPKMAKGFAQQTNENKVLTNPYVACRSDDGQRWIITAWENCDRPWANPRCPCFHSDPKFPDLEPGQMHRLRGWLSFYEGADIEAEFERIEKTGWRKQP